MELMKQRVREVVTNECLLKDLDLEHIEFGCTHAEYMVGQEVPFDTSVHSGIAVAWQDYWHTRKPGKLV